jgi:hypothetical protein
LLKRTLILILILSGCASSPDPDPGQLATRAIEVRYIEHDFETTYKAATHSFAALGYTIEHSEKKTGILAGKRETKTTGRSAYAILALGPLGLAAASGETDEITIFVEKVDDENRTKLRIQLIVDGKPQIDPVTVDSIWIVIQREAMLIKGLTVPEDLEKNYKMLEEANFINVGK